MGLYKINVQARIDTLASSGMSNKNIKLIKNFVHSCYTEGLSDQRVLKYITTLKSIGLLMNKDFDKVTKTDIENLLIAVNQKTQSEATRHDYKISLKKFYKWLYKGDEPELTKWFTTGTKNKDRKLPEDMLTEEEIIKMINTAPNTRDKAMIGLLWDIGARIGEVGTLKIKHVKFDEYGAVIIVNGKTGPRRVRAVWSVSYLMNWLEEHPERDNPEAPLWFNLSHRKKGLENMQYGAIRMQLQRIAETAGIKKRIHTHLFRHSRATYMANHLTEAQMNIHFGWVQGSNMPSIYVHLSGRDVDQAVLKANGIEIKEEENKPKTNVCPRCKSINTPNNLFCYKCGAVLTLRTAMDLGEKVKPVDESLNKLLESRINELVEAKVNEFLSKMK
ncbi:tyrosine-type recombinase/integrase [Methanosarcina sp. UBA5]|uniref:tyrosine-type recombinase/integrase n=1 Tax=Methanosarcina sp. UBA5 TaxID=1915593 RepID=UPI0025D1213C|nr:tyrosine-type recombinase/integrase [Methanosarcina sp. UBA5]